jgi:hypothetical protein
MTPALEALCRLLNCQWWRDKFSISPQTTGDLSLVLHDIILPGITLLAAAGGACVFLWLYYKWTWRRLLWRWSKGDAQKVASRETGFAVAVIAFHVLALDALAVLLGSWLK